MHRYSVILFERVKVMVAMALIHIWVLLVIPV